MSFIEGSCSQTYLEAHDDGLPMRKSGPWAREKLDYLKRYIDVFVTSMRNRDWRAIHYIDLFAGPGKCKLKSTGDVFLGSPLIALQAQHPFTRYFFVDLADDNITALKQRCSLSSLCDRIRYFNGDSNTIVDEVVECISAVDRKYIMGKWSSLNLAFLDPAGLDLQWNTVASLAHLSRMDLIIHYPQGGLERAMRQAANSHKTTKVDLFFGGREWREIYEAQQAGPGLHRHLIDLYKSKLQDLGYEETLRDDETGDEPLMRNAEKKAPLYRLLFASKHPLGNDFWHRVTRRDVYGQKRLF